MKTNHFVWSVFNGIVFVVSYVKSINILTWKVSKFFVQKGLKPVFVGSSAVSNLGSVPNNIPFELRVHFAVWYFQVIISI